MLKKIQHLRWCPCGVDVIRSSETLNCSNCYSSYHFNCLFRGKKKPTKCPACQMRVMDPFIRVDEVIAECYVRDLKSKPLEIEIELKDLESLRQEKNMIEMRCMRLPMSDSVEMTWPDEVMRAR